MNDRNEIIKVIKSKVRTGFVGYILNMLSLRCLYNEYVDKSKILQCVPTFRLSQDPLELFFGKIRSRNGFNDNPTMQQFMGAMRKLIVNQNFAISKGSNCNEYERSESIGNILHVSSRKRKLDDSSNTAERTAKNTISTINFDWCEKWDEINQVDLNIICENIGINLSEVSTAHIANIIEKKIENSNQIFCEDCVNVFNQNEKVAEAFLNSNFKEPPCQSTLEICCIVKKFMKLELLREITDFKVIENKIFEEIENGIFYENSDFSHNTGHKIYLIQFVVDTCIHILGTFIAKHATLTEHRRIYGSKWRNVIHFHGQ